MLFCLGCSIFFTRLFFLCVTLVNLLMIGFYFAFAFLLLVMLFNMLMFCLFFFAFLVFVVAFLDNRRKWAK